MCRLVFVLCMILAFGGTPAFGQPIIGSAEQGQGQRGDVRPVPDPTTLTTQQLQREILALREIIFTRLDGMDKALALLQGKADKVPSETDIKVGGLRDLLIERFKGVETQFEGIQLQFKERDTRVEQTARDSKTAVDAALQAAKEAVEKQNAASSQAAQKSEGAFTKQIDQLAELYRTGTKALEDKITTVTKVADDKIAVLNERLTRIESGTLGRRTAEADQSSSSAYNIAVIMAVVGIVGLGVAIAAFVVRRA